MNDLQPVDLHDLEEYLKSRALVDDLHRPYYVRWIQRFLAGPGGDQRYAPQDAQRVWLEELGRSDQTPEWQISQAARAVDLYQRHYLPFRENEDGADAHASRAPDKPQTLQAAISETRRLLRLRHYAYRTEQTYRYWLSQYQDDVGRKRLPWAAADSARAFIGELAVRRNVAASTQNQAFSARLFLLREVLGLDAAVLNSVRAKRGRCPRG